MCQVLLGTWDREVNTSRERGRQQLRYDVMVTSIKKSTKHCGGSEAGRLAQPGPSHVR